MGSPHAATWTDHGGRPAWALHGMLRQILEVVDQFAPDAVGHTDLDLGLTPDVPRSPGLLSLDPDQVSRVVGHLGVPSTTQLALRVLTEPPASH